MMIRATESGETPRMALSLSYVRTCPTKAFPTKWDDKSNTKARGRLESPLSLRDGRPGKALKTALDDSVAWTRSCGRREEAFTWSAPNRSFRGRSDKTLELCPSPTEMHRSAAKLNAKRIRKNEEKVRPLPPPPPRHCTTYRESMICVSHDTQVRKVPASEAWLRHAPVDTEARCAEPHWSVIASGGNLVVEGLSHSTEEVDHLCW